MVKRHTLELNVAVSSIDVFQKEDLLPHTLQSDPAWSHPSGSFSFVYHGNH